MAGVAQALQQLAAQAGGADGVVGAEATGRVGQQDVALGVQEVQDVPPALVQQALAADGDGDDLAAALGQGVAHQFKCGVLAGAHEQPAGELERPDSNACNLYHLFYPLPARWRARLPCP